MVVWATHGRAARKISTSDPSSWGVLLLPQPGTATATVEGVLIWNAIKDIPAAWAVVKVLNYMHVQVGLDVIGSFSFRICPRQGGGITADSADASLSLALHLGHAPANIGTESP